MCRYLLLAFLPPEPTYTLNVVDSPTPVNGATDQKTSLADTNKSARYTIVFSEKAEWQHSQSDVAKLEPYFATTTRHNRIACLHVTCTSDPKYYILFSHGNAVDLGNYILIDFFVMILNFFNFVFQVKWQVFLLYWVHVYNVT